jgi:hypothetical protein
MLAEAPLRALLGELTRGNSSLASHALVVVGPAGSWFDESLPVLEPLQQLARNEHIREAVARVRPSGTAAEALTLLVRCLWPEATLREPRRATRAEVVDEIQRLLHAQFYFGYPWPYPDIDALLGALPSEELWLGTSAHETCSGEGHELLLLARDVDATALFVQVTTTA